MRLDENRSIPKTHPRPPVTLITPVVYNDHRTE